MVYRIAQGFGFASVALTLVACLPPSTRSAPRAIAPSDGPRGSIYVESFGGAFTRQIQPRFRLDRSAYVLVGHLGGDGEIRVLYPETPQKSGWVSGNKTIRLKPQSAIYDVSPHLYSFASAPHRSFGAQMDSYDGLGHGYVFLITSRYPIDYEAIMGARGYEELGVDNYDSNRDPRYAVRSLADDLTTGPYSLKFARNQHRSLFAEMTGCSSSWGLFGYGGAFGYSPWDMGYAFFSYPGFSLFNGFAFAHRGIHSCRGGFYASNRSFRTYVGTTVTVPIPGTPSTPVTPVLQRPTRRTFENPERTRVIAGRSAIERRTNPTRTTSESFGGRAIRPTMGANDRWREYERTRPTSNEIHRPPERSSRPMDTPRMRTPPTTTTTTTTVTTSAPSGGTKAERPRPNQ